MRLWFPLVHLFIFQNITRIQQTETVDIPRYVAVTRKRPSWIHYALQAQRESWMIFNVVDVAGGSSQCRRKQVVSVLDTQMQGNRGVQMQRVHDTKMQRVQDTKIYREKSIQMQRVQDTQMQREQSFHKQTEHDTKMQMEQGALAQREQLQYSLLMMKEVPQPGVPTSP